MAYVPEAGDTVWLNFTPQGGHCPAVVVSPSRYNRTGLILCCPMTTKVKGYPFEVTIAGPSPSVVLSDQVKCLDWRARQAKRKGTVTEAELAEVRAKALALIRGM